MHLPNAYWRDDVLALLKTLDFQSPREALKGKNEYIVPAKVNERVCFVYTQNSGKLDPRALKCVFIGYFNTERVHIL